MSVQDQLTAWLQVMGYEGTVPKTLGNICTPVTSYIWSEVASNIKPRSQVNFARKNIILARLQKQSLQHESKFVYPVKEIKTYEQKRDLEKTIRELMCDINEKEVRIEKILGENKSKYISLDNLKQKIKQNNERSYIINKKSQMLIEGIQNVEVMTKMAKNLTPVEVDEDVDHAKIDETLRKCAEKLEQLIKKVPVNTGSSSSIIAETSVSVGVKTNTFSFNKCENNTGRKSLELLPDSCLSDDLFNDDFLINSPRLVFNNLQQSLFESNLLLPESLQAYNNKDVLDQLCHNKDVCETLKKFLYGHNRNLIVNNCEFINNELLSKLMKLLLECGQFETKSNIVSQDDMAELYFLHVKSELEAAKYKTIAYKLEQEFGKHNHAVQNQLARNSQTSVATTKCEKLKLQIKKVELESTISFLKEEISKDCKSEISRELQLTQNKINKTKDEIASKISGIKNYVENIHKLLESIRFTREEAVSCVNRLNHFFMDFFWSDSMKQPLFSQETKLFKKFPLEYNRIYSSNGLKTPHRDICDNIKLVDMDPEILHMINILIGTPFNTTEAIINNELRSKVKLKILRSLQQPAENMEYRKYLLQELISNEDYVTGMENSISSTMRASLKQTSALSSNIKCNLGLWTEMPFEDYLSNERKVNGHDYKYYKNKFEELFI